MKSFRLSALSVLTVATLAALVLPARAADSSAATSYKFAFGSGPAPAGYTQVSPTTVYSDKLGYGFEPGATVQAEAGPNGGSLTSTKPFYFSVAVPEGNYLVTATFGAAQSASDTTVKAELRRLMLPDVHTDAGQYVTKTFVVNVRTPKLPGGGSVSLKKPRETGLEAWAWDNRLTLEFNGAKLSLSTLQIEQADKLPTLFIVGDSTSCDQPVENFSSWGQSIPVFFKPDVAVANHGESGESVASSLHAKRFDKVWSVMKPGDYLFVQFGHNDMKSKAPDAVDTYKANLKTIIDTTRQHGGIPVIVTSMNRHTFDKSGQVINSLQAYTDAATEVAKANKVALIDLNAMSKALYESFGPEGSEVLFEHDNKSGKYDGTHHSDFGSYELAKCIILGIQQNQLPLAKSVADGFTFDPAHPDTVASFTIPVDPVVSNERPPGS